jgi:hypothetical protein
MEANGTGGTTNRFETGARGNTDEPQRVSALELAGITDAMARPVPKARANAAAAADDDECEANVAGAKVGTKRGARACNLRSA